MKDDVVTNEPLSIVCDELINPNVVICAELLTTPLKSIVPTLPLITLNDCDIELKDCVKLLNEFIVVYEPVTNPKSDICVDELIAPLNDVKNEPVSLSVIQLPLTLSIAFNLFTNDDVDCDAVKLFKFEIDVTKLAVETEAVNVFKLLIEVTIDAVLTLAVKVFKFEIEVTKLPVEILAV